MKKTAVVLIAHGTVESLDDLPEFLANIRRGHAAPPELVAEVRRRYEAIGGQSPLNAVNRALTRMLEAKLEMPVGFANRLFRPYPKEVLSKLHAEGAQRIVTVPLAQHSAAIYATAVRSAAKEIDPELEVLAAPNWGQTRELTSAFADSVVEACGRVPREGAEQTTLLLTAHSLPLGIIKAGDPYERELRASADAVARLAKERGARFADHRVAFQSQGIGTGMEWLGPDLRASLEELRGAGRKHVVIAPIGFLADHVEILYDLDIEAKAWVGELEMAYYRSASLNDKPEMVEALAAVVRDVLRTGGAPHVESSQGDGRSKRRSGG